MLKPTTKKDRLKDELDSKDEPIINESFVNHPSSVPKKQTSMVVYSQQMNEMQLTAQQFAESGYFKDIRSAQQAFVKIQTGRELGVPPMVAMTGIALILGKPVVGANLIASMVIKSGYKYKITRHDNQGCIINFYDKDGSFLGTSSFLKEDARLADLLNKDNWIKYPRNMYFARAISNGQKWYCPDATSGQTIYTPDELGGEVDRDGDPVIRTNWLKQEPIRRVEVEIENGTEKEENTVIEEDNPQN